MSQPLHHSFILRPVSAPSMTAAGYNDPHHHHHHHRQIIPPERPRPHLTLLRNKTLTSPPHWSRRRQIQPTLLLNKFEEGYQDFEPPNSPTYWKERCQRFQDLCQSSRKRIREMEEDQRQLRRRIHYLEERLTGTASKARSVTPIPSTIVANPTNRECFYMADCEGMSDSEYGEHYYFEEDDDDEEEEEDEQEEKQADDSPKDAVAKVEDVKEEEKEVKKEPIEPKKEEEEEKAEETLQAEVEQRDDKE